jgi:hypothetical protein
MTPATQDLHARSAREGAVGRTAWDLLHDLVRTKAFLLSLAVLALLVIAAVLTGLLRFGVRDGFYLDIGTPRSTGSALQPAINFTHQVSSSCNHNLTGSKGINLRARRLAGAELVQAQRSDSADSASRLGWLENGQRVVLIDTSSGWHRVVVLVDGRAVVGYLSETCASRSTLAPLKD